MYAKEELSKIIEIDPENAGALQYLDNIQKKIDRVNVIQSQNVYKQGMDAYQKGDYDTALSYFNAAYIVNPQREDIKEYIKQCHIKITAAAKTQDDSLNETTNVSTSMKSNKQIQEEMKDMYNSGLEQFSQENYYEALKKFELLRTMASKYKFYDYREQTNLYIAKSRNAIADDLYKQGGDLELREEFEQAYNKYKESLTYVKNHKESTKGLKKLNSIIAQQYYDQGLKSFSAGNRENAIKFLEESLKYDKNKIEAKRALERIR
jgi:tetratricopeptide (TPR) repeat protein